MIDTLLSIFEGIPESYHFIIYIVCGFLVISVFKFLIDFIKIVFQKFFERW